MQPTTLQVLADYMKELAEYSKWLVGTSALVIGLVGHVVKDAKTWWLRLIFGFSLFSFLVSIGYAVWGIFGFVTLSAELKDPGMAKHSGADVTAMLQRATPPLGDQALWFGMGLTFVAISLVAASFENRDDPKGKLEAGA